ncbi:MAG: hypothetical protein J6T16_06485, partial [Opitutales bacterium]|nr:hypothetical protein [Opitutales bacterium]
MKKQIITSVFSLIALAAMPAFGQIYDYNFATSAATDVDWDDILWNATETTQPRDRYFVNINNSTSANVYVRGGATANLADNASMYLQNDTRLIIGDTEGDKISTMRFIADGTKDTFLEITGRSSVLVNKNGVLTMDANRPIRWWNASTQMPDDFVAFMVDGGTVNGSINPGVNANNNGKVNVVFKNGATLNRNTEINPLGMNAKSSFTFDNSTYNVWNALNTQNNGFGNHVMNTGAYNQDIQQTVTITNGAVWNGAGVVENSAVTYYDFSEDITSSGMSGADLTLQVGYGKNEDNYFKFQILNGGKVSAKSVVLSSQENSRSLQTMGSFTFEMQSDSASNMSRLAAFGGTNMNLARTNAESTWSNNFLMKGNSKYQTVGGFAIGRNEDFGGTANFALSGNNNIFQLGGNLSIIPGWNTENVSNAVVNITTEDATNSVFQTNGFNVYSHFNSQVDVKFLGKTNTVSFTNNDFNMYSSQYAGNSTATVEIGTAEFTSSHNFHLRNYFSGDQNMIFSNGVQASIGSAQLYASGT